MGGRLDIRASIYHERGGGGRVILRMRGIFLFQGGDGLRSEWLFHLQSDD